MVEVVRTNFAPIFSDIENFPAHWRTNRRWFSNLFYALERDFLLRKNGANHVKIGLEKKTTHLVEVIHYVTDTVKLRKRDTKTENTLSPHTDVR